MITHYLKVAVRNLLKYKTQNLISIFGLAVGLFCFCVCFYISRFVGSVDKCFENHERIAEVYQINNAGRPWSGVSGKMLPHLQQGNWDGVENFTFISYLIKDEYNLIGEKGELLPYELAAMEVDSLYNKIFTPTLVCGSWEQVAHNRNSIVLSRHTAMRMFDDVNKAIGRQIEGGSRFANNRIIYTIQAVIEDLPENTSMNFMRTVDMLKVNDEGGCEMIPNHDITGYFIYAFLSDNYTAQQLDEAFQQGKLTFRRFGTDYPICANPLGKDHQQSLLANMMAITTGIVGFLILLAASLNFFYFQAKLF